jgi:DNA-binding NarL/FixJ family response regulator
MSLAAEVLVGREREMAALDAVLDRTWSGPAGAVEIRGDAGLGKTSLLTELGRRADRRGALVLQGSASELESDLPFAVFVDALDEYVHGLGTTVVGSLLPQVRAELAGVLPSLSSWADPTQVGLQHERYRTHRAIADLLETVAARQPLVLILDDIHWSDGASAELLMALLRRPPAANILMALGRRPRQTAARLAGALDRAHRVGDLERIEPPLLTRQEAGVLLGDDVPTDIADLVFAECGGNPFYLTEMARSTRGVAIRAGEPGLLLEGVEVPAGVVAAMQEELDLLDPSTRRLLEGAAVVGDPFDAHLAASAAGIDHAAAPLDALTRLGIVGLTAIPTRFRFRHPVVRRAVYNLAGAAWRIAAHQRCAEALAADGVSVTSLAIHVERFARPGDLEAVEVLRRAGDQASLRAPASAAHWYGAAARILPTEAPAEQRAALLLPRAGALAAVGRFEASYDCLLACLANGVADNQDLQVQLTASCAALEQLLGRHDQAQTRLLKAQEKLPEGDSPASVAFLIELSMAAYFTLDYEVMAAWALRALAGAQRLADTPLCAIAGASLTLAGAMSGETRAKSDCTETAQLVDDVPDDVMLNRLDAVGYLAWAELCLERFDAAAAHAGRVVRLARSTGQGQLLPLVIPVQAAVHLVHGELAVADQLLDGAVEAARLTPYNRAIVWTLANRSAVRLTAGDVPGALADAEESAEEVRHLDEVLVRGWTGVRLGAALLASGQAAKALAALEEMGGGRDLRNVQGAERVTAFELLTRCLLATDQLPEARHSAKRAAERAAQFDLPLAVSYANRALAAVDLALGQPERAAEAALRAAQLAADVGAPIEAASARTLAGSALAASGLINDAVRELSDAAAVLHQYGAFGLRDAAEQELRRYGHTVHRRSTAPGARGLGVTALTGRERQIAELVSVGRTNVAIAGELYLSPKTVESHLRTIFRKLNVTSRAQVARHMAQTGTS